MAQLDYSSLPVSVRADVIVAGGGVAGAFAAIAAAREGASVAIIEQFGMLGGSATAGLVTPVMHSYIEGDPPCSYLSDEVRDRLVAIGGADASGREFDPLLLKLVLEDMCVEAGVKLVYYTLIPDAVMKDGRVDALVLSNKEGLSLAEGLVFIDCTGDGDVSVRAGASYRKGNPETGINQPMSLRYVIGGVNEDRLREFFNRLKAETGVDSGAYVSENNIVYAHCCKGKPVTLTPVFEKAIENGELTEEDHLYWQCFSIRGRKGSIAFNCPEFFERIDGTSVADLTLAQINGKKAILRQLAFYRKNFSGFENAYIEEIAPMVGVRESREIEADYVLKAEDLYFKHKFADGICQSNYPIDVHGKVLSNSFLGEQSDDGMPWYDIPFRSLLVKGVANLMVAGRCIGADFIAEASIRVQQSARATGEAAGIGAWMALDQLADVHKVDGRAVKARMLERGARFKA